MNLYPKKNLNKTVIFTALILLTIALANPTIILPQSTTVGGFTLTFDGVSYNITDSTSTWCYTLVWDGTPPKLSHLTIQLGQCAQVLSASPPGFIVGLDGSTGIFGVKWDTTIPANTPTQFCFTLDGLYVVEPIIFAAKAGSNSNIANIPGASLTCQECQLQISCPTDLALDCSSSLDPAFTGEPTVEGNCPPFQVTYNDEEILGNCPPEKTIRRTWTATDLAGLSSSCQQLISLQDITAPSLGCSPTKTMFHPDTIVFDTPEISDNCDSNPTFRIVSTVSFGTDCPYESIYTRTWEAVDACGNVSAQCSQTVEYQNRPPVLTLSDDKTVVKNDTLVISVSAQDPDGTIPSLTALNLPLNANFVDNLNGSGNLIFTPDDSQVGIQSGLVFIATDGCLADTEIIDLHVFIRHDTMALNVYSPVNLVVIDPKLDSIGINFNTILEGSSYDTTQDVNNDGEKEDIVKIPSPYQGIYQLRVIPEDTGSFSVGIRIDGNDQLLLANNVVIPSTDTSFEYQAEVFETLRGDLNKDTRRNLADIVFFTNYIFRGKLPPEPLALGNVNCDKTEIGGEKVNLQDIIYFVRYIFKGGPPPCS